jgi:antitoxin component YwqK of YwqJK toxin-antitoxin module
MTYKYDSLLDGHWIQYYEMDSSKIARIFDIKNGKLDGVEYLIDFGQRIDHIRYYEKGEQVGSSYFFENGNRKDSVRYSKVYKNEYRKSWYQDGKVRSEAHYDTQVFWYDNGQKKFEKRFNEDGFLDGEVIYWNVDGSIRYQGWWASGKAIEPQSYSGNRRKKRKIKFDNLPKKDKAQIVYNALKKNLDYD